MLVLGLAFVCLFNVTLERIFWTNRLNFIVFFFSSVGRVCRVEFLFLFVVYASLLAIAESGAICGIMKADFFSSQCILGLCFGGSYFSLACPLARSNLCSRCPLLPGPGRERVCS